MILWIVLRSAPLASADSADATVRAEVYNRYSSLNSQQCDTNERGIAYGDRLFLVCCMELKIKILQERDSVFKTLEA